MKTPLKSPDWIGVAATLHALATPGLGPVLAIMPLLGAVGGALTNLKRLFF
jgi:hypothetical protein